MYDGLATNASAHTAAIIPDARSLNAAMLSYVREKSPSGLFEFREVHQNLEDEKSPSGLYDVREVHQNFDDVKDSSESF